MHRRQRQNINPYGSERGRRRALRLLLTRGACDVPPAYLRVGNRTESRHVNPFPLTPRGLAAAVLADDVKGISRAPGVGAKTAARVTLELKDKIKKNFPEYASASSGENDIEGEVQTVSGGGKLEDARDALTVLGYSRSEIAAAMKNIDLTLPLEDIIKNALSALMKN